MYRLAIYDDRVIQRIVSNEVARGFLRCLGIFHAVEKIEITDEVVTHLWEAFENHVENTGGELKVAKDAMETLVAPKVARMYEELIDEEYEYTFDEFGEYIMALFIEYSGDIFESFCKACDPEITQQDFDEFYQYHKLDSGDCRIVLKQISGYVMVKNNGFDILLDGKPEYFD